MISVGTASFCDFQTIQAAVNHAEQAATQTPCTIHVLNGTYHERVAIHRSDLTIKGIGEVILTNGLGAQEKDESGQPLGTFRTATLFVGGSRNRIENLTIKNTAGYGEVAGQALAVYADCDEIVFKNCRLIGYQDTLFTGLLPSKQKDGTGFVTQANQEPEKQYRQYYENCFISGSVDFIFGGATAWFHQCEIQSRKEGIRSSGYITAASTPQEQSVGLVFTECWLTAEARVEGVYLGRPWRSFAKTWWIDCLYGSHLHPEGWHDWSNEENRTTVDYRVSGSQEHLADVFHHQVPWATWNVENEFDPSFIFPGTDFYKTTEGSE